MVHLFANRKEGSIWQESYHGEMVVEEEINMESMQKSAIIEIGLKTQ